MLNTIFRISLPLILLVPISSYCASYYGSGAYGDLGAGLRYDSNLSRSQIENDRKEDFISNFNARYGLQKVLSKHSLLNFSVDMRYEKLDEFKALNNLSVGGTANYFYQPKSGFFKPWFEAAIKLNYLKFNKSKIRDSIILDASLKLGKRFTNKLSGSMTYHYNERYSAENVFDLVNHKVATEVNYSYSRKLTLFAGYNIEFGEVVSTAIPNSKIIAAADAVAPDDVFSNGLGPGCMNRQCAYRLDATSHKFNAGMNMNLSENSEIELASQYHHTDAAGGNRYQGLIYHASIWFVY